MKKTFSYISLSLVVLLSGCAKVESGIAAEEARNEEICFNIAPVTKADLSDFDHSNVFSATAIYSQKNFDETNNGQTDASFYIDNATISYNSDLNVWKCADRSYWWPKAGKLTFFAWSLNRNNLKFSGDDSYIGSYPGFGPTGAINTKDNPNADFMVADIVKDKTSNDIGKEWPDHVAHNGVTTIFRHKMSQVAFKIRTDEDYSETKEIRLKSITFKGITFYSTYAQLPKETWSESSLVAKQDDIKHYSSADGMVVRYAEDNSKADAVVSNGHYIVIPQHFANADPSKTYLEIKYTIQTKGTQAFEEVTYKKSLAELYSDGWQMGKRYVCSITLSLDNILWDPAVEDWESVAGGNLEI